MSARGSSGGGQWQWLALFSAVVSVIAAVFSGWQAYEAHEANKHAEEVYERASAERVFVIKSPPEITSTRPDAVWAVVNQNHQPISGVWLEAQQNGRLTAWRVGEIAPCEIRAVANTDISTPEYLHYTDADGRHWRRPNSSAPTLDNMMEPQVPDQSAGSVPLLDCPS
jgi:hypothetical protein